MFQIFRNVNVDWLRYRRVFILLSTAIMLGGLASAVVRQAQEGGTEAFNLGVDFKGGTVITAEFNQRPSAEELRDRLRQAGVTDVVIQPVLDNPRQALIKLPLLGPASEEQAGDESQAQVDVGRVRAEQALRSLGEGAGAQIVQTESVGPIAGNQLRNQAVSVTLLALVGILLYIAFRFEWTYGVAAVVAVFHDVLVTLGIFSIFQWEINLSVIAALLTLVGFSVNDTIVVFDRIRENLRMHRRSNLYDITNDSINQTLSRTVITSGLVFLSVLALVLFGGEVLRGFSLALMIGILFGTYSSVAVASPIMVWAQQRLEPTRTQGTATREGGTRQRPATGARNVKAGAAAR